MKKDNREAGRKEEWGRKGEGRKYKNKGRRKAKETGILGTEETYKKE